MVPEESTESVAPDQIAEGDVIADQLGKRWLTVTEIQIVSDARGGVFSFYGNGPDDRVTFEASERVRRKKP
jgi:hypothetical protein